MSMFVKKKQILAATLVVALAAAVTVNWYYSKPKNDSAAAKTSTVQQDETKKQNLGDSMLVGASSVAEDSTAVTSNAEYFASAKLEQKNVKDEIDRLMTNDLKEE